MRDLIASIEAEYRRYKTLGEGAMDQLADSQLAQVAGSGNSIVTIVWHLAGNLKSRFTDFLTSDGEKPWRDRDSERAPCPGTRRRRRSKGVEPRGLTGRNAQVAPVGASQRFRHIDDLAHVVARVRERAMQRLDDGVRLAPDGHRPPEIRVGDVGEGREQHPPAILPLGLELFA